jgi:hypothetical protein
MPAQVDDSSPNFCANTVWYADFKPCLVLLVGWEARKPILRSPDLAYDVSYALLPDCRHEVGRVLCLSHVPPPNPVCGRGGPVAS